MQQSKPHTDALGRVMGTLILLIGIAMLIGAFYSANMWLHSPIKGLEFLGGAAPAAPPPANIGAAVMEFIRELIILGFMTMIGSILAGKGIALYLGAIQWGDTYRQHKGTHSETPSTTAGTANRETVDKPGNATANPQNG